MSGSRVAIPTAMVTCHFLLMGSIALGASITGDQFTATVSEGGMIIGSEMGIAGMAGDDVNPANDVTVEWLDEDTFEFDFFGYPDITLTLSSLDFLRSGSPVDIVGVSEAQADFGWNYNLSFDAHSITIEYPSLTGNALGDGEIISFDVLTVPEPTSTTLSFCAVVLLFGRSRVLRVGC